MLTAQIQRLRQNAGLQKEVYSMLLTTNGSTSCICVEALHDVSTDMHAELDGQPVQYSAHRSAIHHHLLD